VRVVGHDDADDVHRAVPGGLGGEAQELRALGLDERAPLHQVLGGIAADELLGNTTRVTPSRACSPARRMAVSTLDRTAPTVARVLETAILHERIAPTLPYMMRNDEGSRY